MGMKIGALVFAALMLAHGLAVATPASAHKVHKITARSNCHYEERYFVLDARGDVVGEGPSQTLPRQQATHPAEEQARAQLENVEEVALAEGRALQVPTSCSKKRSTMVGQPASRDAGPGRARADRQQVDVHRHESCNQVPVVELMVRRLP